MKRNVLILLIIPLLVACSPKETLTSEPAAEARLGIGSTMINPADGALMVFVPKGEFLMGSEVDDAWDDQKPEHLVYLDAFWIYQYPVTNKEYQVCVDAGVCSSPFYTRYYDDSDYDNHPVVTVNWFDATTYCEWVGGRLPTEAEWEKAARGIDGRKYPWGNERLTGNRANYCDVRCRSGLPDNEQDDGYERTSPVGSYPQGASPYGALDMAGNVVEWVADWYAGDYYSRSPDKNPTGPTSGDRRVVRGGAWNYNEHGLRVTYRNAYYPDYGDMNCGFRCLITP